MAGLERNASLEGKRLVLIGGTGGIGLSAAKAFVAAGAKIVAVGHLQEEVSSAAVELGASARVLCSDATSPETASRAVAAAVAAFGGFDGLYHVAGGSGRAMGDGPLHEITDEGWNQTLELNLTSVFYSNRAAVRQFLAQKTGGTILNMSSVLALSPGPCYFTTQAYAAAKSAIIGLTKSCAASYAQCDIRFNALAPGLIQTNMAKRALADPRILAYVATKQPLDGGRIGRCSDLDGAAVYFMSEASKFTTGQVLAVDGGWAVAEGQMVADL